MIAMTGNRMLTFLLLLCVAVSDSSGSASLHDTEYIYHYQGHVVSGIAQISKHFSGLKIDTDIVIQYTTQNSFIMKLERIQVYKVNNRLSNPPSEQLTESDVNSIPTEQSTVIKESLSTPLRFRWIAGEVTELEFEVHDQYWSRNIKKGILSLLQVNIYGENSRSARQSKSSRAQQRRLGTSDSFNKSHVNTVYKVMQSDVTGDCEVKYVVNTINSKSSSVDVSTLSTLRVTTVHNYDNCQTVPTYVEGLFAGVYNSPHEKNLIQPSLHTDYIVSFGEGNSFLIKDVQRRGKYFFTPQGLDEGDLSAFSFQELKLVNSGPITESINIGSTEFDHNKLRLILPVAETSFRRYKSHQKWSEENLERQSGRTAGRWRGRNDDMRSADGLRPESDDRMEDNESVDSEYLDIVDKKLEEIISCTNPSTLDKSCTLPVLLLNRLLRDAPINGLRELIKQYIHLANSNHRAYKKWEMLLDTASMLPTPQIAILLLELIRTAHITGLRASLIVNTMSLVVTPTPDVILTAMDVYRTLSMQGHSPPSDGSWSSYQQYLLHKSLLLAVGTMGNRLLVLMKQHGKHSHDALSTVEEISYEMKEMYDNSESETEKELIAKSMGNLGSVELIPHLTNVIQDQTRNNKERINAIFALRRLVRPYHKQVTPTLLNTYMDAKQPADIRIAAFVILRNSFPSYLTLQAIVHRLQTETSSELRSFVYSTIVNIAKCKSTQPDVRKLSEDCRRVLTLIEPIKIDLHDSISLMFHTYNDVIRSLLSTGPVAHNIRKPSESPELGATVNLLKLNSLTSAFSPALVANFQASIFGKHLHVAEVGMEGQALQLLYRHLIGPESILKEVFKGKLNITDLFTQRSPSGTLSKMITDFLDKLKREAKADESLLLSSYIHILDNELQFLTLVPDTINSFTQTVSETFHQLRQSLSEGYPLDFFKTLSLINSLSMATPVGIPLTLNHTSIAVLKVEGQIKVSNIPTWSDIVYRQSTLNKMHFNIHCNPSVQVTTICAIGVDMKWITAGSAYMLPNTLHLPINVEMTFDLVNGHLDFKTLVPTKEMKILTLKIAPTMFIEFIPTSVRRLPFHVELMSMEMESFVESRKFHKIWTDKLTGVEHVITGQVSKCALSWCSKFPLYGKQEMIFTVRPTRSTQFLYTQVKFEDEEADTAKQTLLDKEYNTDRGTHSSQDISSQESTSIEVYDPVFPDRMFSTNPDRLTILVTFGTMPTDVKVQCKLTLFVSRRNWFKNQLNIQTISSIHRLAKLVVNNVFKPSTLTAPGDIIDDIIDKLSVKWRFDNVTKAINIKINREDVSINMANILREQCLESIVVTLPAETKYKFTIVAQFSEMDRPMVKHLTQIVDLMKHKMFKYLTVDIPSQPIIDNEVIVAAEFVPWWQKMTLIVKTPRETDMFIDAPFNWNHFIPEHEKLHLHDKPSHTTWDQMLRKHDISVNYNISDFDSFDDTRSSDYFNAEMTQCCVQTEFMTIRRNHDGVDLICVSNEPVLKCRDGCRVADSSSWTWNSVCFTCHLEDTPQQIYQPYTDDVHTDDIVCPNYRQTIKLPADCITY